MAIFDQWPKLYLGFDVEPEIQILKVIYSLRLSYKSLYTGLHNMYTGCQNVWSGWPFMQAFMK